ncbi:K02A2.6-like, partial [Cordylochernes scorpioides]
MVDVNATKCKLEYANNDLMKMSDIFLQKLEDEDLNDEVENCIDKCIRLKCELDLRHNGQETSEKKVNLHVKMPKLELPTFDGRLESWLSFKDLFYSAIGSNSQIPEIEKLQYLKGQLRGEALRLVNAFPITADNYVEVWQTLLTRYDNPKDLIFTQIDNALRLPKLADDNHKSMFKLLYSCNEIVRTVKVLGYQIDSLSDVFFVEIIQDKLDKTTRKQWELQNNPRVVPSIKDLMEFLEIHAKSLQNLPNKDANVEKHSIRRESHKEMEESSIKRETAPRMEVQQKQWGHPGRSPMDYSSKRRPCRICLNRGHAGRFHPENSIVALMDTGCTFSIIPQHMIDKIQPNYVVFNNLPLIKQTSGMLNINSKINVNTTIGFITRDIDFYSSDINLPYVLLSLHHIRLFKLDIDFQSFTITQFGRILNVDYHNPNNNNYTHHNVIPLFKSIIPPNENDFRNFNSVEFDEKLSPYEKSDLIKLIKENKEAFAAHKMDIGHIKADPIRIKLTSQTPISLKPFRPSFSDNIEIKRQIEELLKYNVIRPSYSSYASPAMLVNKRNEGKIRLVIDYRKLNDIIKRDSEPIPRIDSILDKLSEANIFTTLDLLSGYHHLDIHPDDKEYTAFTTTHGLYEFNKLSFGLKNSPSQFQRVLRQILNKYDVDFCMNYFDDFIIFSNNFQEHLTHLKVILDICIKENIKLKLSKCKFATYQIYFLGYEISNHQFSPSTNNIETIRKLNSPRNKKDLQRVLGSINIYSKFIPNYAKLRLPLNNLLKKDVKWKWDEECETAFSKLKNMITSKPILAIYNPKYPIHLYTDASQEQIGSILKQEQPDGLLKPIAYRSHRMTSYESNYCVTEQECLAIIDAVDFFLPYLDGVHFTIHTDHACLKYLKNIKNPKGRLFRWSLKLSMFDFEIKHIRGTENKEADFLSRYPIAHFVSDPELKQAQFDDNINDRKYTKFNGLLTIKKKGLIKSVVPPSLREKVLIRAHQDYGHIGVSKMLNLISPIYYWPYLIQDISNYVKHCEVCQLNKISHQKKFGLLESLPPAKDPFDLVSIDTVGGLNYYNSTKKFLHIIVDHATRYIWAFPSKSQTTDSYINCLNKIFQIQKPKQFLSDRAPSFTSPRFRKYLINNNIKQLLTSSSRPQCNGLNERLNQTIITRLRCKFNNLKGKSIPWTKLLDSVLNEYNNTPHSITGYTPTYLLYGKLPYDSPLKESEFYPPIDTARTNAYNNTLKFHQINKIRYDQHYQPSTFKVGDKVWLQTFYHPDNRKLMPPMSGPFTILKQIFPVNYEIDKPQSNLGKTTMVIHSSKLRPYYPKEGFELKLTKSKIPTLEKKTHQQVAPKVNFYGAIKGRLTSNYRLRVVTTTGRRHNNWRRVCVNRFKCSFTGGGRQKYKADAKPTARSLPFSLKKKVENEIDGMVNEGILQPIEYANWAAPIVPVLKKDGSLRICGDFRCTANKAIELDKYPLPSIDEIFSKLSGNTVFSSLDLSRAYLQVRLSEEAKRVVNINTTKGLFAFKRLPYGVAVAPNKFQREMDNLFADMSGVACYIDDILVAGKDNKDHEQKLELVFKRLQEKGLRLNKDKCKFAVNAVEYLGFKIDKKGLHPISSKIEAVVEAPEPTNVSQLRSFIGLLMYYSRFIRNIADILAPFYHLLKKNSKWNWTGEHRMLFAKCKALLTNESVLAHYDATKELVLACDASSYGLGVVLSHRNDRKEETPIAFASRTLTEAERRIKRWSLKLSAFKYTVEFRKTDDNGNADALSRLPLVSKTTESLDEDQVLLLRKMSEVPFSFQDVAVETRRDKLLSIVLRNVRENNWQIPKVSQENPLCSYYRIKDELSCEFGCLQWRERVIIPQKLRSSILNDLHEMHLGMVKMKMIARRYFWWPGIDKNIEELARDCRICQESASMPPSTISEWTWPEKPWHRLHLDLAGPFMGRMFMVLVDAYTKWLEIVIIKDITSRTIIGHLREIFARFGLPELLVTDNGRQFVSSEFEEFTKINSIRHTKTSPYNPSTNGLAERYVREFKTSLRKNQGKDSVEINLQRFLFAHRAFPQTVLKESPAELLMKRNLRSRFSNLIPKMAKVGEVYHDAMRKQKHFSVGSDVYFRSFVNGPKWKKGRIMELLSSRHYLIEDEGRYVKRHINQLRPVIKREVPEVRDLVLPGTSRDFILPGTSRDHPGLGGQEKTREEAPEVDEELKGAESSAQEDTPEPEPGPAAAAVPVPVRSPRPQRSRRPPEPEPGPAAVPVPNFYGAIKGRLTSNYRLRVVTTTGRRHN